VRLLGPFTGFVQRGWYYCPTYLYIAKRGATPPRQPPVRTPWSTQYASAVLLLIIELINLQLHATLNEVVLYHLRLEHRSTGDNHLSYSRAYRYGDHGFTAAQLDSDSPKPWNIYLQRLHRDPVIGAGLQTLLHLFLPLHVNHLYGTPETSHVNFYMAGYEPVPPNAPPSTVLRVAFLPSWEDFSRFRYVVGCLELDQRRAR